MSSHKDKAEQQTLKAMFRYKKCRKPKTGEALIICWKCRGEFHVPLTTTTYRCPRCQTINSSSSGNGQSNKDSGNEMGLVKSASATNSMIKYGAMSQNASRGSDVLNQRPNSFSLVRSFSSAGRSNKRAVLCGVTYRKKDRLKGPINDVVNMRELLVKVFDFPTECIHVLTEEEKSANFVPTKKNIVEHLKWLVEGCQKGDSLVFYFSGHGTQQIDLEEDEIDGLDEGICPVDFLLEGMILDNELNAILVWPLQHGVTLHAIVDGCHSGTILDLLYVYDPERCMWKDNKPPAKEPLRKYSNGGQAICISACEDHQTAADTSVFGGKGMNGAMTYLFTLIIRKYPDITYRGLIEQMRKEIEDIMRNCCRPSILQHMFGPKFVQDLVISSSEKFDLSRKIFTL